MWKDVSFLTQDENISSEDLLQFQIALNRKLSHALSYVRNNQIINIEANKITTDQAFITNAQIGSLEANKITTVNAKITTAQIETLTVGGNVIMGPNATISWDQVSDQPTIPVLPSYITSTKITSTTIESPTITGGIITGGTFRTASSGARIQIASNTLNTYNSVNELSGLSWGTGVGNFGDVAFYWDGNLIAEIFYSGLGLNIEPTGNNILTLGAINKTTEAMGNWNFDFADVTGGQWDFTNAIVSGLTAVWG